MEIIHKQIEEKMSKLQLTNDLNENAQITTRLIYNTAITSIGYRKYRKRHEPWWKKKLKNLKKLTKQLQRKMNEIMSKYSNSYKTVPKCQKKMVDYKLM